MKIDAEAEEHLCPLRRKGWLSTRPKEVQDAILELGHVREFAAGVFLYRVGDPPSRMFGICEGRLQMLFGTHQTADALIHSAGPGAWFGHPAVLAGDPMTTAARTSEPLVALVILQRDLYRFLERRPKFNREFFSMLNYTRKVSQSLLTEAFTFSGVDRLAHRLGYLAETGETDRAGQIVHSQEELARMLALSPATVQRGIRLLKSKALIESRYGSIRILDLHGLRHFSENRGTSE